MKDMEPFSFVVKFATDQMRLEYYEESMIKMVDDKKYKRDDIAKFYAFMIFEHMVFKRKIRSRDVNLKILTRYKNSGLDYIKEKAWKIYHEMTTKTGNDLKVEEAFRRMNEKNE